MDIKNIIKESKNKLIYTKMKQLNTPEKLAKWMDENTNYAFRTKDGIVSYDFEHMFPEYRLQSPFEFFDSKVGVCWDQAVFEYFMFTNIIKRECKMFYIVQHDNAKEPTHTFVFYKDRGRWMYFENAFHRIKGIYYIKDNKDMFDYIIENMRKENPHDFSVEVFEINKDIRKYTNNFTVKTDIMSFMTFCQSCKRVYKK